MRAIPAVCGAVIGLAVKRGVHIVDKKIYIVAKIFDKPGSLAYLCKTPNEARCLPGTLEALRAEGVQTGVLYL